MAKLNPKACSSLGQIPQVLWAGGHQHKCQRKRMTCLDQKDSNKGTGDGAAPSVELRQKSKRAKSAWERQAW